MKKNIIIFSLLSVVAIFIIILICNNNSNICFLNEYKNEIEQFSSALVYENINDKFMAESVALDIWVDIYGESIYRSRPFVVELDECHKIYLVKGTLNKDFLGGVPYLLIQQDGKVLAVWHTK